MRFVNSRACIVHVNDPLRILNVMHSVNDPLRILNVIVASVYVREELGVGRGDNESAKEDHSVEYIIYHHQLPLT